MEFIKAFEDIDKDFSGEITREELTEYMHQKNYKPAFVEKWLRMFDSENTGVITLEEFCSTLGLVPSTKHKETIDKRNAEKQMKVEAIKENELIDVEVIAQDPDVTSNLRDFTLSICLDCSEKFDNGFEMSKHIKKELDKSFARCWHVVVSKDSYGCFVSHEKGGFIHIRSKKWGIMMWHVEESKT